MPSGSRHEHQIDDAQIDDPLNTPTTPTHPRPTDTTTPDDTPRPHDGIPTGDSGYGYLPPDIEAPVANWEPQMPDYTPPPTQPHTTTRTWPVVLYLDNDTNADQAERALTAALHAYGFHITHRDPSIRHSLLDRWKVKLNAAAESQVTKRLGRDLERAIELRAVHQVQAQVDATQSEAVATLLNALGSAPNAMVQIGSVLLIKVNNVPMVRNLTQIELTTLERNPSLHADPAHCLRALQQAADAAALHTLTGASGTPESLTATTPNGDR